MAILSALVGTSSNASAQAAGILRPSIIADSSRTLSLPGTLAGYTIGARTDSSLVQLGKPLKVDSISHGVDGMMSYANLATGVTLIASDSEGVGVIFVTRRDAGAIDNIRVGDTRAAVAARWGPAAAGGKGTGKGGGLWLTPDNVITILFDDDGRITRLGIGRGVSQ